MTKAKSNQDRTHNPDRAEASPDHAPAPAQTLREIGLRSGTDKITHHRYDKFYTLFLEKFRARADAAMLEIGLDYGKSLKMWLDYFPLAFIYGIDIRNSYEGPRQKTFLADQSDIQALQRIATSEVKHPVFLIVDDGSHLPEHQLTSFNYLFEHLLEPGGIYIMEDIEVSYWSRGELYGYNARYGFKHPMSILEVFKSVIDSINDEFLTEANRYAVNVLLNGFIPPSARDAIETITFGKNCIIIVKKQRDDLNQPRVPYRFAQYL
jgi:hypothetical protein